MGVPKDEATTWNRARLLSPPHGTVFQVFLSCRVQGAGREGGGAFPPPTGQGQ